MKTLLCSLKMNNSDQDIQFNHRSLLPRQSSANISTTFHKKASATYSASREKSLEFMDLNVQLEKDNLSKALKKEGFDLQIVDLENVLNKKLTNECLKCIYFTCVYIINNYFGACGTKSEHPQNLLKYVNQLFPLPSETKQDYLKKAKKVKSPHYILPIEIIAAKNLIPTDVDCLSDPYCRIWMNDQKETIKRTSVKENTLFPEWKERFSFRLNDINSDVIHIEIWDKDPRGFTDNIRQIRNIKGLKGFRQFCREFCRSTFSCDSVEKDDFVAKVDIPVNTIYSKGFHSWIGLKDIKDRSMEAKLHLLIEFKTLRPKCTLDALKRHLLLLKYFLQESIENTRESFLTIVHWEQLLPPSASTLIFLHTIQSSLSSCEDLLCRFIVFVYFIQNKTSFNYHSLYSITYETYEKTQEFMSAYDGLENDLNVLYREAVHNVYEICKSVITKLHSIDFVEDENKCIELEFVLKCAALSHEIAGKEEFLWSTFNSEAVIWFDQLAEEINSTVSYMKSEFLSKMLSFILSYHSAVDKVIRNIFPDKSYTQFTFEVLDSVLSENLKPHIANLSHESLKSDEKAKDFKLREALTIFLKIKDLTDYVIEIVKIPECDLQIASFREWFGSKTIEDWFRYKEGVIIPQINQIISNDNLESTLIEFAGRVEKQGPSVKLIANLIQKELIQLINYVHHPKYPEFDSVFLEVLHSVSMKYCEFLMDLIYSRNILANFQSTGMKKLCTLANNLWSMSVFAQKIISDASFMMSRINHYTKFCLRITCSIICADICKEFEQQIATQIRKIVIAGSIREQKQAINSYVNRIEYLFNEETMPFMALEIYLLFMRDTLKTIIKIVMFYNEKHKDGDIVETFFNKCRNLFIKVPNISSGLLAVLNETEKLCFIDYEGKLKKLLWDDDYKMLKSDLNQSLIIR